MLASFTKRDRFGRASLMGEARALSWLAEAEPSGGIHVAKVISATNEELVEERITTKSATVEAARCVGAALARTHAAGGAWWGCPPEGWSGSYRIDHSLTPTVDRQAAASTWGAFYAEHRVMTYVRVLRDEGAYGPSEVQVFDRLANRLCAGTFDVPQPRLVVENGHEVARLHGDLWAGNLLWDANTGNATGAALIDPMAHGGHAETDLAMLALFGCSHLQVILSAYDEVSPLADGWRERVALHQLSPVLLHCVLFGGGFLGEALAIARHYV
jgi:fructosamine-3-kinase